VNRVDVPATASIELWDSGVLILARAGDTLQTLAATYNVPLWAPTQANRTSEHAAEGDRIMIPRHLVPIATPSPVSSYAPTER
jgi:hypothetical protein